MRSVLRAIFNLAFPISTARGFTLIESSVVLVVTGLIIGCCLKGQELISSSKEKALIDDVAKIQAAVMTFRDRYYTWPGDYPRASMRINAAAPNGNGDGSINRFNNGRIKAPRNAWRRRANMNNNNFREHQIAWLHLSMSSILDITDPTTTGATRESFPRGPHAGSHFELAHAQGALRGRARSLPFGLYIRYAAWDDRNNPRPYGIVRLAQAQRIDMKLDDGAPFQNTNNNPSYQATVFASNGSSYGNQACGNNSSAYADIDVTEKSCFLLFRVE